jgi:hypothetical protein
VDLIMSNDLDQTDQLSGLTEAAMRYGEACQEASHRRAQAVIANENLQVADCDAFEAYNNDQQSRFDSGEERSVSMGFAGQVADQPEKDQEAMGKEAFQAKLRFEQCRAAMKRAELNVDSSQRSLEEAEQNLLGEARMFNS